MSRTQKRLLTAVAVIAVIVAGYAIWSVFDNRAQMTRKREYTAILQSYSAALKPGMNRMEIENFFHARNIAFRQMCCVDVRRDAYADLVKIGKERAPWFCSENNVYIAFEFASIQTHPTTEALGSDRLLSIREYPWLEECL
jgi:hypothetical protein